MTYPKTYIKLTSKELRQASILLKTLAKNPDRRKRIRVQAVLYSDKGKTITQIAKIFEVTDRSVRGWFTRYRAKGLKGLV